MVNLTAEIDQMRWFVPVKPTGKWEHVLVLPPVGGSVYLPAGCVMDILTALMPLMNTTVSREMVINLTVETINKSTQMTGKRSFSPKIYNETNVWVHARKRTFPNKLLHVHQREKCYDVMIKILFYCYRCLAKYYCCTWWHSRTCRHNILYRHLQFTPGDKETSSRITCGLHCKCGKYQQQLLLPSPQLHYLTSTSLTDFVT